MRRLWLYVPLMVLGVGIPTLGREASASRPSVMDRRLGEVLEQADPDGRIAVIVSFRSIETPSRRLSDGSRRDRPLLIRSLRRDAERAHGPVRAFLEQRGVGRIRPLWHINALAFEATSDVVLDVAGRPDVVSVRLDQAIHIESRCCPRAGSTIVRRSAAADDAAEPAALAGGPEPSGSQPRLLNGDVQAEWHLAMVNAPQLWTAGLMGQGVVVATMDTGVDIDHPDLQGSWRGGGNSWLDTVGVYESPHDSDGHGTGVMGVLVGGSAGGTAIGVAPLAQWIAVRIFDDQGGSTFSRAHEGFQWLLDPDGDPNTDDAPDIVTNSWEIRDHVNECVLEFYEDIQLLREAGIAVVFAAGNSGPTIYTSVSPANYDNVVSVGAVDDGQVISLGSSRGPAACGSVAVFPLVVAPGEGIRTADLTFGGLIPLSYSQATGTSYAAPVVSGIMALLLSGYPGLGVEDLENLVVLSAGDLGAAGPDWNYGYGLVDAAAGLALAQEVLAADLDGDDDVDLTDLGVLAGFWLSAGGGDGPACPADFDGNGEVNLLDYGDFVRLYGLLVRP